MTTTIKNLFTRTQIILLASLLALVFLSAPSVHADDFQLSVPSNPADGNITVTISDDDTPHMTYQYYFDGSTRSTKPKKVSRTTFAEVASFDLKKGPHTLRMEITEDGVLSKPWEVVSFYVGTSVPLPTAGIPKGYEYTSRNTYPFYAIASKNRVYLNFNCVVPNKDHSCQIYQNGKLIKAFEVKTANYGRYTTYAIENLKPYTTYTYNIVGYEKTGSLPDKPRVSSYEYTPTLTVQTGEAIPTKDPRPAPTPSDSRKPAITVLTPNGGEQWDEGVLNTVTWSPYSYDSGSNSRKDVNPARDVTAYLEKKDDGGNFITLGKVQESGKASIHWRTGELNSASRGGDFALPSDGYYIRVVNNKTGATDRSDKSFTLLPKPIKIKVNGKENWVEVPTVKTPITVSWETTPGVSACQLSGMKGISFSTIQPGKGSVTGLMTYEKYEGGVSYGVELQCVKNGNQIRENARFSVTSIPQEEASLKITSPNGGEKIDPKGSVKINFDYTGLKSYSVALYKNDQWKHWIEKDAQLAGNNTQMLTWQSPEDMLIGLGQGDNAGAIFKIYVTGQRADGQGYIEDKSDAPFSFIGDKTSSADLKVNGSDGPLTLKLNEKVKLSWKTTGMRECSLGNVNETPSDGTDTSVDSIPLNGTMDAYYTGNNPVIWLSCSKLTDGNRSTGGEGVYLTDAPPSKCRTAECVTDKTAPTAPKNLKVVADSATQVTLTWGASTDAGTGILGYQILRNNPNYKTGSKTELPFVTVSDLTTNLSFVDTGLKPGTLYEYTVTALDKAKEANSSHSGVTVKTPAAPVGKDTTAPSVPGTATVTNLRTVTGKGWTTTLGWGKSTDAVGVTEYVVKQLSPTPVTTITTTGIQSDISGLVLGSERTVSVQAKDAAGNLSSARTVKFKINFNGMSVAPTIQILSNTPETVSMVSPKPVTVTVPPSFSTPIPPRNDTVPPTAPTNLKAVADSSSQVTLSWSASTDVDTEVSYYVVYRNDADKQIAGGVKGTKYVDNTAKPSVSYTYKVSAFDEAGNESLKTSVTVKTPVAPVVADTIAPTVPTNFRVTASTTASITFSWNASTDASGIKGYSIYRDGNTTPRNPTPITSTIFTDSGLTPATTYTYTVEAIDNAGNKSTKGSATLKTPSTTAVSPTPTADILPPSVPQTFTATANSVSQITLAWGNAVDVGGIKGYNIYRNGGTVALNATPVTALKYVDTGLTAATTYSYTIEAVDNAGNKSVKASASAKTADKTISMVSPNPVTVTVPAPVVTIDKTVPSVPVSATVANVTVVPGAGWSAALSWGASTDNVGVTGYIVKSIAPKASTLTTTTGKTFTLTNLALTAGATVNDYTVSVQAKDARGNLGPARVVKFHLNFAGIGALPTVQIISNTVDTTVQKVVAQAPTSVPLTSAENTTNVATLTALMNKLAELNALMASVKMSR